MKTNKVTVKQPLKGVIEANVSSIPPAHLTGEPFACNGLLKRLKRVIKLHGRPNFFTRFKPFNETVKTVEYDRLSRPEAYPIRSKAVSAPDEVPVLQRGEGGSGEVGGIGREV